MSTGGTCLYQTRSGWTFKLRTTKFGLRKLETSLYPMVQNISNRLGIAHQCYRRTDRRT